MRPTPRQRHEEIAACPPWCRRDHHPGDATDDLLHQSGPAYVAVVLGDPRFAPDDDPRADTAVLRLVQRTGTATVWLEAASEEGASLHLLVSAGTARRLAAAMTSLLAAL